jgi:hypothetical protein
VLQAVVWAKQFLVQLEAMANLLVTALPTSAMALRKAVIELPKEQKTLENGNLDHRRKPWNDDLMKHLKGWFGTLSMNLIRMNILD